MSDNHPSQLDRHVWEYRWIRDVVFLLAVIVGLYGVWSVRAVTLPILLGFGFAYLVNPLVTWVHDRLKVTRWVSTLLLMFAGAISVLGLLLYIVPKVVHQLADLFSKLPSYVQQLSDEFGIDWSTVTQAVSDPSEEQAQTVSRLADQLDVRSLAESIAHLLGASIGVVSSAIGSLVYLGFTAVIVGFCFFFFCWRFDDIVSWFVPFIPKNSYAQTTHIIGRMDRSVSAFVRGRLVQAGVMGCILSLGWWVLGVPYWLLLGLVAGTLNLIPYAASIGWLAAISLAWIDCVSGGASFSVWFVLVWPSAVYLAAQLVDGWVVEPVVQGKATDLDPLTVMLVVLVGGSLAGVMGVILAIPVAACVKILASELILPRLRAYAASKATTEG